MFQVRPNNDHRVAAEQLFVLDGEDTDRKERDWNEK